MTCETPARAGTRGRLVVLSEGGLEARHDGVWVSMVLTSRVPRRRSPERNPRIPTVPVGYFGVVPVNVSAVDTGPLRSESRALAAEPGASVTGPPHRPLTAACAGA